MKFPVTIRINLHSVAPVFFATELCGYVTGVVSGMSAESYPLKWWNLDALVNAAAVGLLVTMVPCLLHACLCVFVARRMGLVSSLAVSAVMAVCGTALMCFVFFGGGRGGPWDEFVFFLWPITLISGLVGMYVAWRLRNGRRSESGAGRPHVMQPALDGAHMSVKSKL